MKANVPTPTAVPPPSRDGRRLPLTAFQIILLLVGALILLAIGLRLEEDARGHAAWQRYEAEARRRGVKLTMAELAPPPLPDAENFASIPIFAAAAETAAKHQPVPDPFQAIWLGDSMREELSRPGNQTPVDLRTWQAAFVKTKLLPVAGVDPAANVLKALDRYAAPLSELHAARARRRTQFPLNESDPLKSPEYLGISQGAARLFALRLDAHLAQGDSAAAYEDFADGLHLATATIEEPLSTPPLVRRQIVAMLENEIWAGLAAHRWAEPELRKIEADLAALDWLQDYLHYLATSRAEFNRQTDLFVTNPQLLGDGVNAGRIRAGSRKLQQLANLLYPVGWIYQSRVRGNRYVDELATRIDLAGRRWISTSPIRSYPSGGSSGLAKFVNHAFFLIGYVGTAEGPFLRAVCHTDEARLACALERFRFAHGSYPATLAELVPEFISAVPAQVVDGRPYHYRLLDDGNFLLYSVGTDLVDHGGVFFPGKPVLKPLDWIWRYPASEPPSP